MIMIIIITIIWLLSYIIITIFIIYVYHISL